MKIIITQVDLNMMVAQVQTWAKAYPFLWKMYKTVILQICKHTNNIANITIVEGSDNMYSVTPLDFFSVNFKDL